MDALILSCSTGGGHNAAARAIKEELELRGHNAVMMDPYKLAGRDLDKKVGNSYVSIAQKTPRLFGIIYKIGNGYRNLPFRSPVYALNKAMHNAMRNFLAENHFDVIVMTHLFPGEILAYMKRKGEPVPKQIFVATDYVCIPFTEELDCDFYVIPSKELESDFIARGIPAEKLLPAGIPVRREFSDNISQEQAKEVLGLDKDIQYLLLSGGSMGGGLIGRTVPAILKHINDRPDMRLIVICGNNDALYENLKTEYGDNLILIKSTDKMALYMKACEVYLSKPGGLSSTEAAVSGTPLIHISPIPGCEDSNMEFFDARGMSIAVGNHTEKLTVALCRLQDKEFVMRMRENQKKYINASAGADICDLAERIIKA